MTCEVCRYRFPAHDLWAAFWAWVMGDSDRARRSPRWPRRRASALMCPECDWLNVAWADLSPRENVVTGGCGKAPA